MRTFLLIFSILLSGALMAQKTKTNTAKIDFIQYPTVPVEGMEKLGIQVYTADLPFNKDTLRLYLGNIDFMKSNAERMSKVGFQALKEVAVVGGEGDITIDMAFGTPMVLNKEQKQSSCMVPKDGCSQYYYLVKYRLPALVQARNASGVLDTWELESEMDLQFGNEQIEKHSKTDAGSVTSIQVVNYTSEIDLVSAFNKMGAASLARKGIVTQLGRMAESVYEHVFFEETTLKLDFAYGNGKAADYAETETASSNAVAAMEGKDYAALQGPIKIWNEWLERHDAGDKNAAVNDKVAQALHENLSTAYTFTGEFDMARDHLDKALKLAQTGFVNENEVNRLKDFHGFIDKQEKVKQYNSTLSASKFVSAPDIKSLLANRKQNEHIDFLIAEDKYNEIQKNLGAAPTSKNDGAVTLESLLTQSAPSNDSNEELNLDDRVENDMLVLSGLIDFNMRGKALPESICKHTNLKTIRARNIGFTSLPDCIGELINLEKLYINSNSFDALPDAFGSMKVLEVLDISNNNLKTLPESIYGLTQLKNLTVSGNQLSAEDMKRLSAALPDTKIK